MITAGLRLSGFSNPAIFELHEEGVRPCSGLPLPSGRTAFQHFFAPLWQSMNGEYLLAGHGQSPFTSGMAMDTSTLAIFDAEYARWVVDLVMDPASAGQIQDQADLTLFRPGVVAAWGHSVKDDWCSIIGLGPHEDYAKRIATKLVQLDLDHCEPVSDGVVRSTYEQNRAVFRETVLREARSVFTCQDGRFWEVYVEDPSNLDAVAAHALRTGPYVVNQLSVGDWLNNSW